MNGIIVAAGLGSRIRPLTDNISKCMLPVKGRTLLEWNMERMRLAGCDNIIVILGHKSDAVESGDAIRILNKDYMNNNILHSLMYARDYLQGEVMISYCDIWVESHVYEKLAAAKESIEIVVDTNWQDYYIGRTEHPIGEAENVFYDNNSRVAEIGKHLEPDNKKKMMCGEFPGLWYMNSIGTEYFCNVFDDINRKISGNEPFQNAKEWRRSYITDLFQEIIDRGFQVNCTTIEKSWAEIDTVQDYERLMKITNQQRLLSLCETKEHHD